MCGILGSINQKINTELVNIIKHRGPDRQAIYNDISDKHEVNLAHTRLSILDLSAAGNQPMISECGNYVLIFNGEIYNHKTLRKELKFNGFKGYSDTETLLYFLIEKGIESVQRLNGIFSFAFYNRIDRSIFLCRDPYGVKPLYYSFSGNRFVFSSEIRPINKVISSGISRRSLGVLLNLRYIPSPYTLYESIYKLRPGHYGKIDLKKSALAIEIFPYFFHNPVSYELNFEEAVTQYGRKLENAIRRQLMGDVEMGILLSGGIDSALVGGIAARNYDKPLKAFTVGFDSRYLVNEIGPAAETARYFGMEHHVVKVDVDTFFDVFSECSHIVEEPLATTSFIPMYYLSKLASQQVKVVLTGQGADEPLGGYGRYQGEILRNRYPRLIFSVLKHVISLSGTKKEKLIRGAYSLGIKDDVERFMNIYSLFTPEEVKKLTGENCETSKELINYYYRLLGKNSFHKSTEKMMALDLQMNLADDLLLYTDKITMNFSLECRVPMLDLELVSFLESLPLEYKVKKGQSKIIHKEYAKRILPQAIINRPKLGFQSPTDIWFREKIADIKSMLLDDSPLAEYVDKKQIQHIISQHIQGYNREKQLFLLLSINEWLKANNQ